MLEDIYFKDEGKVKITAASVGVGRRRWTSVNNLNDVSEIASKYRFDILPNVVHFQMPLDSYYSTDVRGDFTKLTQHRIKYDDVIDLATDIRTVINLFHEKNRDFYFLTFNGDVKGLITLSNINCKQVQVYLFSLICDLETALAELINNNISNEDVRNWLEQKSNQRKEQLSNEDCEETNNKYQDSLDRYSMLEQSDLENNLTEELYLVDLFTIIKDYDLHRKLDYSGKKWKSLSEVNELRNKVAHPTRNLLDENQTLELLYKRLNKIDELLFTLKNYLRPELSAY